MFKCVHGRNPYVENHIEKNHIVCSKDWTITTAM